MKYRKLKIVLGIMAGMIVLYGGYYGYGVATDQISNPFKVTDPAHPDFNPKAFRLRDYHKRSEMRDAAEKLFDKNSTKDYIELMLVERGGAEKITFDAQLRRFTYRFDDVDLPFVAKYLAPPSSFIFAVTYHADKTPKCLDFNGRSIISVECRYVDRHLKPLSEIRED